MVKKDADQEIGETINVKKDTKIDFEKERFEHKLKSGKGSTQDNFMKLIISGFKKHKKVAAE